MRKLILYEEQKLNILVSQIELEYHKTIIYHMCEACRDPILINDFHSNGEQCHKCKKWYCTKKYINENEYFESCSYEYLSGFFEQNSNEDSDDCVELICYNCIIKIMNQCDSTQFCEHILDSINSKKKINDSIIVLDKDNNKKYYCEECDAAHQIVIYI